MRAIVLSGGGGKGAYEIGVWKALRKLHITYDIVTGTSIGALNGALMVQKSYLKALSMWYNIDFSKLYDVELKNKFETAEGKKEVFQMYEKNILKGGMDTKKIQNLINQYIDVNKFYNSRIDYGLVTYNISKLKAVELPKKKIPREKLKDYLMASATCFPAFKIKDIDGIKFIDGGIYDNMPINLAVSMGATEVIAVDLDAVGIKKTFKDNTVKVTYIKPRNDINSFLVFDKMVARRAIKLGYNDTMKVFDKLDGEKYTFKHHSLHKNYNLLKGNILKIITNIMSIDNENKNLIDKLVSIASANNFVNNITDKKMMKEINKTIEYLGKIFEIDETKIYTPTKYNEILFAHITSTKPISAKLIEDKIKKNNIKDLLNSKFIVKYFYNKILNLNLDDNSNDDKDKKELNRLSIIFKKEFMAAIYLSVI